MRLEQIIPTDRLKPYVKPYVISENLLDSAYKVFPSTGLVMGFQYRGQLVTVKNDADTKLATAGITGISDQLKIFKNSADTGTILIYFTEIGFHYFTASPADAIFNQSISLDNFFERSKIIETEEKLHLAATDKQRIHIVEQFLLSHLKDIQKDKLIIEALNLIYASSGSIKIKALAEKLFISQSPLEKRFKNIVGTTPKKFSSILRFNTALKHLSSAKSLTDLCYEYHFFDQAHFIKNFKQYTGDTPENFKRFL